MENTQINTNNVNFLSDDKLFEYDNSIVTFAFKHENVAEFFPLGFENTDLDLSFGVVNKFNTLGQEDYKNLYIIGLGENSEKFNINDFRVKIGLFLKNLDEDVNVDLISTIFASKENLAEIFTQEFIEQRYEFAKISNKNKKSKEINLFLSSDVDLTHVIEQAAVLAKSTNLAKNFVNLPSNYLVPDTYVDLIEKLVKNNAKIALKVMSTKELKANEFGLITAVNEGSQFEAYVVCLEFKNDDSSENFKTIVGKGITYDTGGLSLKTGKGLVNMKTDMAGSATAVGIILGLSELNAQTNVRVIIGITENSISASSYKVDGVLVSKSKKTVEIENTDAEGRLVLADLVTYAQEFKTDEIITISTLTGSNANYFGQHITPIHGTNSKVANKIAKIANKYNNYSWAMPLDQFSNPYAKALKDTPVADLKNLGSGSDGITAAAFVNEFIENKNEVTFSHIDIAGTSFDKLATGVMVKPLIKYLMKG